MSRLTALLVTAVLLCSLPSQARDSAQTAALLQSAGRGMAALARGDTAGALAQFEAALKIRKNYCPALHGRGVALAQLERLEDAQKTLEQALKACPERMEVRLDLAVVYLARSNAFWAVRVLSQVEPPDDPRLAARHRALLGMALIETGQAEDALELDRLGHRSDDPEMAPWSSLVAGRASLALGQLREARLAFAAAAAGATEPALRQAALQLLDAALLADTDQRWYAASAAAGVEYDTNALYDPELPTSSDRPSPAAGRSFIRAALTLEPLRTGRHLLGGDLGFFRSFHFANADASSLDLTEVAGTVRYTYRLVASEMDHAFEIRYQGLIDLLEGGSLLPRSDRFVFLESHGGSIAWTLAPSDWLATRFSYAFYRRQFSELGRDAWMHQFAVAQTLLMADRRLRFVGELGARLDQARAKRYDLWGMQVNLRAVGLLLWGFEAFGGITYSYLHNYDSAGAFDTSLPDTAREDSMLMVSVGLGRAFLSNHLTVAVQYRYYAHVSTIPVFDYERQGVSLVIGGRL